MASIKRGFLLLLITTVLFSSFVSAGNFSAQTGFDWLSEQNSGGAFDADLSTTAWAVMALDAAGYDTSGSVDWLYTQMSTSYCLPSTSCTIEETALAILALKEVQDDTYFDEFDTYLMNSMSSGSGSGAWYLQVVTEDNGTCTASYELNNITTEIEFEVDEGAFPDCSDSTFLDINSCLQTNLISNNPGITIDIDCTELASTVIALVYKSDSTYYLLTNENSNTAEIKVNNGCFGRTADSSCNLDASLTAGWALDEIDSTTNTAIYLKENYDSSDVSENALMYLITEDESYLEKVADSQKTDGSFDRSYATTSLAIIALSESTAYTTEIDNAKAWLREEQSDQGSWGASMKETAMILYAAFSDEPVSPASCSDGSQNQGEDGIDCGGPCEDCGAGEVISECTTDDDCLTLYDETYTCELGECVSPTSGCVSDTDCSSGEVCLSGACVASECNYDGNCEYGAWNENSYNCPSDCYCGDGVCDNYESESDCSSDCGEEDSSDGDDNYVPPTTVDEGGFPFLTILIIIIILALIGGGGYWAYTQGYLDTIIDKFKGKPKGPTFPTQTSQFKPFTSKMPPNQGFKP